MAPERNGKGPLLELDPARPSGSRYQPERSGFSWTPGDEAVAPDERFGAGVRLNGADERMELTFADRVQPRWALTLTVWVRWGRSSARASTPPEAAAPETPAESAVATATTPAIPVVTLELERLRARRTRVTVTVGDDQLVETVDLDAPRPASVAALGGGTADQIEPSGWHHLSVTWTSAAGSTPGSMVLLLDGVAAASGPTSTAPLPMRRGARVTITSTSRREFWSGPVRLHDRLVPVEELLVDRGRDLAARPALDERHPLAFRVGDNVDEPTIYITDDDVAGRPLHVVVENRSRFPVELPVWSSGKRPETYLELRFRPGCLAGGAHHWVEAHEPGWRVETATWEDGAVSLFLGRREQLSLGPGQTAAITLHHVRASGAVGAHSSTVELVYTHPHHPGVLSSRTTTVQVVGQRGRRTSPLRFGAVGDHSVFTGGVRNRLELYVANASRVHPLALRAPVAGVGSTLVLTADVGEPGDDWALATPDQLAAARLSVDGASDWRIEQDLSSSTPQWILTPTRDVALAPGGRLSLVLDELYTDLPVGRCRIGLRTENVPGYWDEDHQLELYKSHVRRDGAAGALEVHGDVRYDGMLADRFGELLPPGVIVMWHGSTADVPAGWLLCDGTDDTPDLRNRFIRSAEPASPRRDDDDLRRGGADAVQLPEHVAAHDHTVEVYLGEVVGRGFSSAPFDDPLVSVGDNTLIWLGSAIRTVQDLARDNTTIVFTKDPETGPTFRRESFHTGTTASAPATISLQPSYFDLCFIMKQLRSKDEPS